MKRKAPFSIVFFTLAAAVMGFAFVQELPEGEGKKLVQEQCTACHGLETAVRVRLKRAEWEKLIAEMAGPAMDSKQVNVTADYLAKHFGVPLTAEEERTAKRFIEGVCSTCHDAELITGTEATKEDWLAMVKAMNNKGAGLSEQDVELLAEYLARNYGKK